MARLSLCERRCLFLLAFAAGSICSPAQTFNTLVSFDNSNGSQPTFSALVQGLDGNFYGTTPIGGAKEAGTVFRVTPQGTLTTLHSFCTQTRCGDGKSPKGGVILGTDGNLYGTTEFGGEIAGQYGQGEFFEIDPGGTLTPVYLFGQSNGDQPFSAPIQASNGDFYVTTPVGGQKASGDKSSDTGAVFRLRIAEGMNEDSYSLCAERACPDGRNPFAGVVEGSDGNLYGTTSAGGSGNAGTIFKITPRLTVRQPLTTLHSFDTTDGAYPYAGLVQASDGNFYGTTELGGANGAGTIFQITSDGTLMTLYSFCSQATCADGETPVAGLVQATDGALYGTTELGGANASGTIFRITPTGTLTTLYSFCAQTNCGDGGNPLAGLAQGTDGNFYGAASSGGASNYGTIFSLATGLGPFVETLPTSRRVGMSVHILGTNLAGSTSVTFNGTSATFAVVSSSQIEATVPTGATTGSVSVTTPSGVLTSNVPFRVIN
jgi:uncharacterized repeat protein (TIGR03803 family)